MTTFTEHRRAALAAHLRKHIAGEVRFDEASRQLYSTDASIYQMQPLGVVVPRTVEDVVATVQTAAEMRVPITARGGGTSLSGQSIGPGVVLDCSKYLDNILDLDPTSRVVRVQPGVVLDTLNRTLAAHGLQFGPDVATASRANLGGMIGNNSAGSRSIVYGKTIDHVRRLGVVLADGRRTDFGPLTPGQWQARAGSSTPDAPVYRRVLEVVRQQRREIRRRFPRILRRVSGYNLDVLCDGLTSTQEAESPAEASHLVGLHQLVVGSEGTLAVVTEAELNVIPVPKHRGLLVPQFASLAAALDALAPCLELRPSAVELMDHMLIELSAGNLALRDTMKVIRGRPQALLMVEFSSDDEADVAARVDRLRQRLQGVNGLTGVVPALDPALREPLWNWRRASMPLLYGMPGDRKPVTFVEDAAVAPERLPEFAARFRDILKREGTDGAFYGHASVGCLHIRPLLNLKDAADIARMHRIAARVTDLVLEYGGALSGEHGDGLARSEWNEKMFGPAVYAAFQAVKTAFDPDNVLNPGRVVNAPPMTANLRYDPARPSHEPATVFDYSREAGFVRAVEMCNGNGACRKTHGGTMCPSYWATRDERDSTRGRANVLRLALTGAAPERDLRSQAVHDVYDLCLMCKACKAECPSNVDVAKLKAEFLQFYYDNRRRPLGHHLVAALPRLNRFAARFAPLVNWLQERRLVRWLFEKLGGIDRRRSLPPLHFDHFRRQFGHHRPDTNAGKAGRVLLLADCFTTYNEPEIGTAAVRVLERAGYSVELADVPCCGRTLISKGFLLQTKALMKAAVPALARQLGDGQPLLGLEPSCLLTLADEWPELLPGAETRRIAAAARLAEGWLAEQVQGGRCELPLRPCAETCVVHGHCHQKALVGAGATAAALRLVPRLEVSVLDTGCCGMAGSFGFEKEHYDLSVKIANLSLLPALAAAPTATVVAPGTSCRHQIHDLTTRRALHPLEVIAGQLG
jgi:FAD/FMN-containing dehydrogenase/Fe-S oxidoreductase